MPSLFFFLSSLIWEIAPWTLRLWLKHLRPLLLYYSLKKPNLNTVGFKNTKWPIMINFFELFQMTVAWEPSITTLRPTISIQVRVDGVDYDLDTGEFFRDFNSNSTHNLSSSLSLGHRPLRASVKVCLRKMAFSCALKITHITLDTMFYMLYPTKTVFHSRTEKIWTDSQNDYKKFRIPVNLLCGSKTQLGRSDLRCQGLYYSGKEDGERNGSTSEVTSQS